MKKLLAVFLVYSVTLLVSCKKESLQSYLVESNKRKEVTNLELPINFIELTEDHLSIEKKAVYKTIKKVSFTGFAAKKIDGSTYEIEKNKLKKILGISPYKKLMKFKSNGNSFSIYRIADSAPIDEIIVFGYGKKLGVGVARILGDNMKCQAI